MDSKQEEPYERNNTLHLHSAALPGVSKRVSS